ncbi:MAG TPA: 16S rRNA processing protein RimM [Clostridiaceae bacterium]|jgi:16S rRNA processing protein RimM|nr:16S rRNA processing protein RimM [Clostridiaceae bacterium]HOA32479.1 ribosome maturation factor RimM [Clostridia bacterium]
MVERFVIGKIVNAHGIRGELKVLPETEDPNRFKKLKKVWIEKDSALKEYEYQSSRILDNVILLALKDVDTRDKALNLKGAYISVSREDAIKLPEGRYFIADLIGCTVYEHTGEILGKVKDVFETGSNDVYDVVNDEGKSILVPALEKVVKSIDVENRKIIVELLPGLKEIYYEN